MGRHRRAKRARKQKKQPYTLPDGGGRGGRGGKGGNGRNNNGCKKVFAPSEVETDPHRISQRQKQIDYGKNTEGYARYIKLVPRDQRSHDHGEHPRTPNVRQKMAKRSFQGLVRAWRRALHRWDPKEQEEEDTPTTAAPVPPPPPPPVVPSVSGHDSYSHPSPDGGAAAADVDMSASASISVAAPASPVDGIALAVAALDQSTLDAFGLSRAELREAARDDPELLHLLRSQMADD